MGTVYDVLAQVNGVIKGKEDVVTKVMEAILSGGHILMEDIPGVGKTTLSTAFAKALSMDYKRVQFTPDVLPSDIVGFSMYNSAKGQFEYVKGPVFCNFFLADEINRTSPKTQSALLEVMEEGSVTVDGITRQLDDIFTVIATQNPSGSAGTNMLPESQLDRFMIRLSMGYPGRNDSIDILKGNISARNVNITPAMDLDELKTARKDCEDIFVHDSIYEYITDLCEESRNNPLFSLGVSPRGGIALLKMSKANAYMEGVDYVRSADVENVIASVFSHRIKLSGRARSEGISCEQAVKELLKSVTPPRQ